MSVPKPPRPRAIVLGCAGTALSAEESDLYRRADPFGFILFRRNCETPQQVRDLVAAMRESVGRDDAPVLIDQEGGRVARLRPPHWPKHPPARAFGELAERDRAAGREAAWLNGRLLAHMLVGVGITVDCAPVCDVPIEGAHDVIGDRAFSRDPALVADLARATCEGLVVGGVLPVVKHLPGHGRAFADSHAELPVVDAPRAELEATDFAPFRDLADMPLGMVAHVVLKTVDPFRPASTSPAVIADVIRGPSIGFDGLLFSDDLSMGALSGDAGERTHAVLAAGCDVALHCNGVLEEMVQVADAAPILSYAAAQRWARAQAMRGVPDAVDAEALRARLDALLTPAA
ncbi:beta-N-acetylhexosaminidase [Azospirillum sp.]|uniref:beta-N-acetylhexosaminidase n=1 Tax=Azospirillum sp. TaxID=34012 RepID=UPI003D718C59